MQSATDISVFLNSKISLDLNEFYAWSIISGFFPSPPNLFAHFLETMVFCYQNCYSDREKVLKFEADGQEFAKFLRSLEQFIQTAKGQNNFW